MKIWKRNAVIAAVLLFICAGIYLNWSYNRSKTPELISIATGSKCPPGRTICIRRVVRSRFSPARELPARLTRLRPKIRLTVRFVPPAGILRSAVSGSTVQLLRHVAA